MDIYQVAEKLNEKASRDGFQIAALPELRKKYLHKKKLPSKLFTYHSIKDDESKYAFHHGGRDEMQFNVGEEYIEGKSFTRYALCFSLEASRSLTDPVDDLEPFRTKFNQCVENHPRFFKGIEMWYYQNGQRHGNFPSQKIPDEWFQYGTFIAIGKMIDKPLAELNEVDLTEILNGFDNLLPIYQFCVLQSPSVFSKEKRIARLCWNTNNWESPIGHKWKIEYQDDEINKSFEQKYGYGHEEWLFNPLFKHQGFQYGYIQGLSGISDTEFIEELHLFTIDNESKKRFYVGLLKDVELLPTYKIKKEGIDQLFKPFLGEMIDELKNVNAYYKKLKELGNIPNIRFALERANLSNPLLNIRSKKFTDKYFRYQPFHYTPEIQEIIFNASSSKDYLEEKDTGNKKRNFKFKPGDPHKSLRNRTFTRPKKLVQSLPLHDKIQKILYNNLVATHGKKNVGMETDTGLATRIDVSVNTSDGIILYEIKSYPSVMNTIREALGQLLEYAYYPNPIKKLKEMIIVSHIPIKIVDKEYLEFIRKTTLLKIYYQSIDIDKKIISKKM